MKLTRIAIAAGLLATSGAAAAQSANDARCLLLSNAFAKQAKDAQAQKLAEASLYFYLGRIATGETAAKMKALFDAQTKTITDANAGNLMNECVKDFQSKMDLVGSLGTPPAGAAAPTTPPKKPEGR